MVASIGSSSGEIPYTVFMARKSRIEKEPEMVQKFTDAIYRGQIWVDQHSSQEIARAIAPFFPDTDIDGLSRVVERYKSQNTWSTSPVMNEGSYLFAQEIMQMAGELSNPVEPAALINHQFAEQAILNTP